MMRFVLILGFIFITAFAGPMKVFYNENVNNNETPLVQGSKEELTNSLISLKSHPTEQPPAQRQKRSVSRNSDEKYR